MQKLGSRKKIIIYLILEKTFFGNPVCVCAQLGENDICMTEEEEEKRERGTHTQTRLSGNDRDGNREK